MILDAASTRIEGEVDEESTILGKVILEEGARITRSVIRGPAIIGTNTVVEDSYVGPFTSIGANCRIRHSEVEFSILLDECEIQDVGLRIEGSLLGHDVHIVRAEGLPRTHRFMIGDQSRVEIL